MAQNKIIALSDVFCPLLRSWRPGEACESCVAKSPRALGEAVGFKMLRVVAKTSFWQFAFLAELQSFSKVFGLPARRWASKSKDDHDSNCFWRF